MYSDIRTQKLDSRGRVKRSALETFQRFTSNLSVYVVRIRLFAIYGSSSVFLQAAWGVVPSHWPAIKDVWNFSDTLSPVVCCTDRSTDSLRESSTFNSQSSEHPYSRYQVLDFSLVSFFFFASCHYYFDYTTTYYISLSSPFALSLGFSP